MNIKKILSIMSLTILFSACNSGTSTTTSPATYPYQFVVDSGSSGSRIYVYSKVNTESGFVLTDLYEKKTNTPLASFAANPTAAGTSIMPLLESAIQYLTLSGVTGVNTASIPTSVLGTAGMRLIPESSQAQIYANVAESIAASGLMVGQVQTITGQYEGVYSWLDVNYLQSNLSNVTATNGILEVGGASAQVAFATTAAQSSNAAIMTINANGRDYNVYSTSFLGLGQDYARAIMNNGENHNQCYPAGYTFNGNNSPYFTNALSINGDFNYNGCVGNYESVINNYPLINGINQVANFYTQNFVGVGSVYYALNFWGIESSPNLLANDIQQTCVEQYSQMKNDYPNAFNLQNQCANSVLINNMMFNNLQFESNQLYAVASINGTNLTYTLGFALINY